MWLQGFKRFYNIWALRALRVCPTVAKRHRGGGEATGTRYSAVHSVRYSAVVTSWLYMTYSGDSLIDMPLRAVAHMVVDGCIPCMDTASGHICCSMHGMLPATTLCASARKGMSMSESPLFVMYSQLVTSALYCTLCTVL